MDLSDRDRVLGTARLVAALLGVGPLLLLALTLAVPPDPASSPLVVPAGVLGLVAPAVAWRVQASAREKGRGSAAAGHRAYVRSVVAGLSITEAAALLGVLAWLLSGQVQALIGLPMHLVMVGALWPTEERLRQAEGDPSG
jgi:hypothetical protein